MSSGRDTGVNVRTFHFY